MSTEKEKWIETALNDIACLRDLPDDLFDGRQALYRHIEADGRVEVLDWLKRMDDNTFHDFVVNVLD